MGESKREQSVIFLSEMAECLQKDRSSLRKALLKSRLPFEKRLGPSGQIEFCMQRSQFHEFCKIRQAPYQNESYQEGYQQGFDHGRQQIIDSILAILKRERGEE